MCVHKFRDVYEFFSVALLQLHLFWEGGETVSSKYEQLKQWTVTERWCESRAGGGSNTFTLWLKPQSMELGILFLELFKALDLKNVLLWLSSENKL